MTVSWKFDKDGNLHFNKEDTNTHFHVMFIPDDLDGLVQCLKDAGN